MPIQARERPLLHRTRFFVCCHAFGFVLGICFSEDPNAYARSIEPDPTSTAEEQNELPLEPLAPPSDDSEIPLSVGGGLAFSSADGAGLGLRAEVMYTKELWSNLTVGAEFIFYAGESDEFDAPGLFKFELDYRLIEFAIVGHYALLTEGPFQTYGLAGVGFASLDMNLDVSSLGGAEVDGTSALALHAGAGAEFNVMPQLSAFTEMRLAYYLGRAADASFPGTNLSVDNADLGLTSLLLAGVRYSF